MSFPFCSSSSLNSSRRSRCWATNFLNDRLKFRSEVVGFSTLTTSMGRCSLYLLLKRTERCLLDFSASCAFSMRALLAQVTALASMGKLTRPLKAGSRTTIALLTRAGVQVSPSSSARPKFLRPALNSSGSRIPGWPLFWSTKSCANRPRDFCTAASSRSKRLVTLCCSAVISSAGFASHSNSSSGLSWISPMSKSGLRNVPSKTP
mmetsp:Transcript_56476/g.157417  ORF Transcript_56476/g.157417 Transcript_56476/m.157417 type:complete len:206 (+) Transcript_56476:213-830(+)